MTSKYLLLCTLGSFMALFSSCAPLVPYQQGPPLQALAPGPGVSQTVDDPQQKNVTQTKKKVAKKTTEINGNSGENMGHSPNPGAPRETPLEPTPQKPTYRYAIQIPGKEGFVFNPFTNNPVDVRGIPSGTLVRDPQDPNPDHKFRVP